MAGEVANKVQLGDTVLIDLTSDTVTAEQVVAGYTAHDASGETITGTHHCYIQPYEYDWVPGYVMGTTWYYQNSTNNHSDFYTLEVGEVYLLVYGETRGTRFRAVTLDVPPESVTSTSGVTGTNVSNATNPAAFSCVKFTADRPDLAVTKDNASKAGLHTVLIKVTGADLT